MRTKLRLEAISRSEFDARLARLGSSRITRTGGATYLERDGDVDEAIKQLALAGIRSSLSSVPSPETALRPAIAVHLEPLDAAVGAIDVVEITRISLSDATAALMRRRLPWLRSSLAMRDACLRLLREEDAVIGWRRIVWCSVPALRVARTRVRLRPVVFDRAAVGRHELRWTFVSAGSIGSWAFS